MKPAPAQDAALAGLIADAAAVDAAAAPPPIDPATGAPIPAVDWEGEARMLVNMIGDTLQAIYPTITISEPTRGQLAAAWAPVMEKYDVTGAGLFGQYSAEIGAIIVTAPVALKVYAAVKAAKAPKEPAPAADGQGWDFGAGSIPG